MATPADSKGLGGQGLGQGRGGPYLLTLRGWGQGRAGLCMSCVPTWRKGQGPSLWCAVVRPRALTLGAEPRQGRATPADSKGLGGQGWAKAGEGHTC